MYSVAVLLRDSRVQALMSARAKAFCPQKTEHHQLRAVLCQKQVNEGQAVECLDVPLWEGAQAARTFLVLRGVSCRIVKLLQHDAVCEIAAQTEPGVPA